MCGKRAISWLFVQQSTSVCSLKAIPTRSGVAPRAFKNEDDEVFVVTDQAGNRMQRRALGVVPLMLLLLLFAVPGAAYVVFLKDGSQIVTKEKYSVEGARATLVLPGGSEVSYAAAEIDFERTLEANGKPSFLANECNDCHGVAAVGIRAKKDSDPSSGPDLSGYAGGDRLARVSAAQGSGLIPGWLSTHPDPGNRALAPLPFDGTEEDLQAILDWLGSLEAQE